MAVGGSTPLSPVQPKNAVKPLKILTLDGGGLQAISTLVILDRLLEAIAEQNASPSGSPNRKPRPCEIFDTIAGIGAGGWLAILLGRFRMDIPSCLSEWYKITESISPRSKTEELRMRLLHHCYFDTNRLVAQIDDLTKVYGVGDYLFEPDLQGARTRHVFVAALKSDASGYNLFRTYEIPKTAKLPEKLLEGPDNPHRFKISRAFGVTGAAKYFTPEWKEQMSRSRRIRFSDTKFPKPHNITDLALDEMWAIYGKDVELSVVINLGPGLANEVDMKRIARRFSWGSSTVTAHTELPPKKEKAPEMGEETGEILNEDLTDPPSPSVDNEKPSRKIPVRFHQDVLSQNPNPGPPDDGKRKRQIVRSTKFGTIKERDFADKLRRAEEEIESDIKIKLGNIFTNGAQLYFRIAPITAAEGTAQNDSSASGVAFHITLEFLDQRRIVTTIDEAARRILENLPAAST